MWSLQHAKAQFSELVRQVHSVGPQTVSFRGKPSVIVITVEDYDALHGANAPISTYDFFRNSPLGETPELGETLDNIVRERASFNRNTGLFDA